MQIEVELPDMGPEGGDHATVVEWFYDEGDYVEAGETLLEVAGESGSVEVPAPQSGTVVERLVSEDDTVRIGEPVAVLEVSEDEAGDDDDDDDEEPELTEEE